jgi:hypothetical protein
VGELVVLAVRIEEVLVNASVTIVIEVVTYLLCRDGGLADPTGVADANSLSLALPEFIGGSAGLGLRQLVINEAVAVIINAVTNLQGGRKSVATGPADILVTCLEPEASADIVLGGATSFAAIGEGVAVAATGRGQTESAFAGIGSAGGLTFTISISLAWAGAALLAINKHTEGADTVGIFLARLA